MDVSLTLINAANGEVFAESEVPIDSLPRSFAGVDTQLTVGESEYTVVRAEPSSRDEIAAAGKVTLTLQKVTLVDPKKILFSLPSLEDVIPKCVDAPAGVEVNIRIAPDDYRQVEFVHSSRREEVEAELADIRKLIAEHRKGAGFDAVHVRKRVRVPLGLSGVPRAELEAALEQKSRPFAFRGEHGVVEHGYAIPDAEAVVYGVEHGGVVETLCIHGMLADVVGKLHGVALAHGLLLVDWCNVQCLRAHEEGFIT